jgi:hypothetical protein
MINALRDQCVCQHSPTVPRVSVVVPRCR